MSDKLQLVVTSDKLIMSDKLQLVVRNDKLKFVGHRRYSYASALTASRFEARIAG